MDSPFPHFYKPQNVNLLRRGDYFYEFFKQKLYEKKIVGGEFRFEVLAQPILIVFQTTRFD